VRKYKHTINPSAENISGYGRQTAAEYNPVDWTYLGFVPHPIQLLYVYDETRIFI